MLHNVGVGSDRLAVAPKAQTTKARIEAGTALNWKLSLN